MAESELTEKQRILERIQSNVPVFDSLGNDQYRIRCPFCGDSRKDPKKARLYLKCSQDPSEPILYNCFNDNCSAKGRVDRAFFEKLGITAEGLDGLDARRYNRLISVKSDQVELLTGEPKVPSPGSEYIGYRLGRSVAVEDLARFKIVWDFDQIRPFIAKRSVANTLPDPRDSISFLSDDMSVLLTRFFADGSQYRWKKARLRPSDNRSFYTIRSTIDLIGAETITVNIAEGIFDTLSIYLNFNTGDNSSYIGCLGNDYRSALDHMVAKGIFGRHVTVNVYVDGDVERDRLKARFKPYRWLFGEINLRWNAIAHDFGVTPDKISMLEHRV